jgi:acyl-CoA thioesterase I
MSNHRLAVTVEIVVGALSIVALFLIFGKSPNIANYPPKEGPIVFLGDSLVEGVGASKGSDLPALLSRSIGRPVENFGVAGNTTGDGLARLDSVIAREPSVVLILLGGNDYLRRVSIDETFANLRAIIAGLQVKGAEVILLGVRGGLLSDPFESRFENLAKDTRSAYVSDVLDGLVGDSARMSDAVHPNDIGYAHVAERILPVLRKIIKFK